MLSKPKKIKIPKNIFLIYVEKINLLIIKGSSLSSKSIKLKVKIIIDERENTIKICDKNFLIFSNKKKKSKKTLDSFTLSLIKTAFLETTYKFYVKLKLIGVGYKTTQLEKFKDSLLLLTLGYSHPIYFKIPNYNSITCLKKTKIFIFGNLYHEISQLAAFIRSYKVPEPYKGKGILYENEKISLKTGKKI